MTRAQSHENPHVLVVLGCVVARLASLGPDPNRLSGGPRLAGAAGRRALAAARAVATDGYGLVVVSGGRAWSAGVEADAIAEELVRLGVPRERIVRERASHTTRENARYVAAACARRGISRVDLVTCDWHAARARALFEREGLEVGRVVPAESPRAGAVARAWRWGREIVLRSTMLLALAAIAGGCSRGNAGAGRAEASDGAASPGASPLDLREVARAEDLRRAKEVSALLAMHDAHDPEARRAAARALARVADADAVEGLLRALADEDATVVAWGAYGLGATCKGREASHVKALAARAVSLDATGNAGDARDAVDPRFAIARALGKCGGADAEATLASWVRTPGAWSEAAGYALADVAHAAGSLADDTVNALLDATKAPAPLPSGLAPFARMERVPDAIAPRVIAAASALLDKGGAGPAGAGGAGAATARAFAVRALGRCGPAAATTLGRVAADRGMTITEREDAARGLHGMGDAGRAAAAEALAQMVPDAKDALAFARLAEDEYGVLASLVASLGAAVPKKSEPAVVALASLGAPGTPGGAGAPDALPALLARRVATLRCGAAAALSNGAYDSDVLARCDPANGEIGERARLEVLLRRPLVGERRAAWRAFAKSEHVRVREAAIDAIDAHGSREELGDAGRAVLAEALADERAGVAGTAADVVHAHPERVMVLADSERRAALDPAAPPPSTRPAQRLDPAIDAALRKALARAWPQDLVETRAAILDAAVAVQLDVARSAAEAACRDPNVTIRDRASRAMRALGQAGATCGPPPDAGAPAAELAAPLAKDTRVVLATDAGDLAITLEPELAPIAATRFVALAKAGYYDGVVAHRVVPGFVVQFGDKGGDGYGGAGKLLRCETSPVPFGALDVGVALAGRDTGSSQLFVTLARWPHLDGDYARVGRAEGDWARVAEGDVIRSVKVEE